MANSSELERLSKNSYKAFKYQKLSVNSASVFTLTVPEQTKYVDITVESDVVLTIPLRYLITGETPTATDAVPLNHLDRFDISDAANIYNFKVIRTTVGTHTLHIQYFR